MKICRTCKESKEDEDFSKDRKTLDGKKTQCRTCDSKAFNKFYLANPGYTTRRNHETGRYRIMSEAKDSAQWLGIYVAEQVLENYFQDIEKMPPCNRGYDFKCRLGYKIDVKAACLRNNEGWYFRIAKNKIADYFLCLAFDNRNALTPLHIWLIPSNVVNNKTGMSIANAPIPIEKWAKYEKPIGKVIEACNLMKSKKEG